MMLRPSLPWNEIAIGLQLEPLDFPVTYSTLAKDVVGTRDLYRIHHDPPFARANGAPDIFLNTMWYQGLIGRYLTDWAGYESFLRKLKIKIQSHGCPGDTLRVQGRVVGRTQQQGHLWVDLEVTIDNGRRHDAVVGTVTIEVARAR